MNITKAIIPVAGWGTRRLPITKTIEKCMLPIGNRPVVDYTVQDCIKAGITDIYFVISEQSSQLRNYYRTNIDLSDYLRRNGKESVLELIQPPDVSMHYIVQSSYEKYGTAIPVSLVVPLLAKGESVVVFMGDDCIYHHNNNKSEVARMIKAAGGGSVTLGVKIPHDQVSNYGVIVQDKIGNYKEIIEKPSPKDVSSNLINVSKYILNYDALKIIEKYAESDINDGEYGIVEPINEYVSNGGQMKVLQAEGEYLDSGNVKSWLHANEIVISSQD